MAPSRSVVKLLAPAALMLLAIAGASAARSLADTSATSASSSSTIKPGATNICSAALHELRQCQRSDGKARGCCEELMSFAEAGCFCNPVVMGFYANTHHPSAESAAECATTAGRDPRAVSSDSCQQTSSSGACDPISDHILKQERVRKIVELHELWYLSESLPWAVGMTLTAPEGSDVEQVPIVVHDVSARGVHRRGSASDIHSGSITAATPMFRLSPTDLMASASSDVKTFDAKAKGGRYIRFAVQFLPCSTDVATVAVITSNDKPGPESLSATEALAGGPFSATTATASPASSLQGLGSLNVSEVEDFEIVADLSINTSNVTNLQKWVDGAMQQVDYFLSQVFPGMKPVPNLSSSLSAGSDPQIPPEELQALAKFMQEMGLSQEDVDIEIEIDADLPSDVLTQSVEISIDASSVDEAADVASKRMSQIVEWAHMAAGGDNHRYVDEIEHGDLEDLAATFLAEFGDPEDLALAQAGTHTFSARPQDFDEYDYEYGEDPNLRFWDMDGAFEFLEEEFDDVPVEHLFGVYDDEDEEYWEDDVNNNSGHLGLMHRVRTSQFYTDDDEVMQMARESLLSDEDTDLTRAWEDYYDSDEWELDDHLRQGNGDLSAVVKGLHDAEDDADDSDELFTAEDLELGKAVEQIERLWQQEKRLASITSEAENINRLDYQVGNEQRLTSERLDRLDAGAINRLDAEVAIELNGIELELQLEKLLEPLPEEVAAAAKDIDALDAQVLAEQTQAEKPRDLVEMEMSADEEAALAKETPQVLFGRTRLVLPKAAGKSSGGYTWSAEEI